jgi:dipeptidyl-peptidase 4
MCTSHGVSPLPERIRTGRGVPAILVATFLLLAAAPPARAQSDLGIDRFLHPGFPSELVSAGGADRIAWIANERGHRNVYTAAAPDFVPVRLTGFDRDDGIELSGLSLSDDGRTVVFVRGSAPNRSGGVANPESRPEGQERAIWAVRTDGGPAWRLAEGGTPALSPDGRWAVFIQGGALHRVAVSEEPPASPEDRGETPFIRLAGRSAGPVWSPDGTKLAFVSDRTDHSYIVVHDLPSNTIRYIDPGVDRDTSPTWSPDGRRLAFIRRPGVPFGRQSHDGPGGLGNPRGPAFGGTPGPIADIPGLRDATFRGGHTLSFRVADVETGESREFWHNEPNDPVFPNVGSIAWAGAHVIFQHEPGEWIRIYSVAANGSTPRPVELTPGVGQVETRALSRDGGTLYYGSNVGDPDRRHVWAVPTGGGVAVPLTRGDLIALHPVPLASGTRVAALTSTATRPLSVSLVPTSGGAPEVIFPELTEAFPTEAHVIPEAVTLHAEDGFEFHNQLFLPADLAPGERRPAIVFVHGGPVRQMLLGYHDREFYHAAYAVNQWLASQGYVVLSVNFRLGIGYGRSFRNAAGTGARGNAEYLDVVAAGRWLQSRPDVDPERIGIWGLSYGGVLTAQALARNSDLFKAGVDLAGVHLWGSSLDPEATSFQSSPIAAMEGWRSPVLLWHADDDRNVQFSQTTGLVQLLRAHDVHYELIVHPDDVHWTLLYRRAIEIFDRMDDFLRRFVRELR